MWLARIRSGLPASPWRVGLVVLIVAMLGASWTGFADRPAAAYLEQALARTLATFAVARGANAAISFLKDADVTITPVGVGVTVSPGEILDPIDDLIEQLSTLLLWAATSLGIQRIGLELSGSLPIKLFCTAAALIWLGAFFWRGNAWIRIVSTRLLVLAFALRWLVPTHALVIQSIDHHLLSPRFNEALAALTLSRDQASALGSATTQAAPDQPWSERVMGLLNGGARLDLEARVVALAKSMTSLGTRVVELMVVFSLQTIVLPLAFVWLSTWLLRVMLRTSILPAARP
ncbi:MAG: hypothetical protein IPK97_00345 [Ahniella sp.]|nr:hypothetical protein [Ahniella sp.]